jgi:hypothetical protein
MMVWNFNATKNDMIALTKTVHIVTVADTE